MFVHNLIQSGLCGVLYTCLNVGIEQGLFLYQLVLLLCGPTLRLFMVFMFFVLHWPLCVLCVFVYDLCTLL